MGMAITTLVVVAYQHDYQVIRLLNEDEQGIKPPCFSVHIEQWHFHTADLRHSPLEHSVAQLDQ